MSHHVDIEPESVGPSGRKWRWVAFGTVITAAFGWYQVRRQRAGRDPLVEPSLFRHGPYRAGIVCRSSTS